MILLLRVVILLSALALGGCATLAVSANPVEYKTFGDAETVIQRQKDVLERFQKVRAKPPADQIARVKVLQDTVPEGVEIKDGTISIKPGAPYTLIGKFRLKAQGASTLWFYDYDPSWRKPYCYWQVPLTWVTISLWQWLVPISYPCMGGALGRTAAIEQVKTLAAVAGANLVVLAMKNANDEQVSEVDGILLRTSIELPVPPKKGDKPQTAGLVVGRERRREVAAAAR
jgi:hypothetical protein